MADASAAPGDPKPTDLEPFVHDVPLAVARFPVDWRPAELPAGFCALVADESEVTVVAPEETLARPDYADAATAVETGWRRITFPGPLPWELVGFLADVAARLAAAHVPFTSMSGYTTDHVLVRAAHADLAVSVLRGNPPPPQRPGTNP